MTRFQINSSQLFLTYPQCDMLKEEAYQQLDNKFKPTEILVAHELHKNGTSHLHAYLRLEGPHRTSDPNFADLSAPSGRIYHGNYQGCRSSKNVIKYCTKEDNYVSNFDVAPLLAKRSNRREHMESLISGKRTLEELIVDEPQYLFNYNSLNNSLKAYQESQVRELSDLPIFLPNPWGKLLPIRQFQTKQRHFHLYSEGPNAGKTTFALNIIKEYGGILVSNREPYWPLHKPKEIRFIFLDELNTARLRFDELNAMADGTYCYRRFGSGIYQFPNESRPIIILMGNVPLNNLYPFMYETLFARFKVIDLSKYKFI